jgi:CDP-glucose 4,6-dehydratase
LAGYLLLGAKLTEDPLKFSEAYNFGPHFTDALPVTEMVKMAIESWGSGHYIVKQDSNQPHEAGLLKLDISKAITELNWIPKFNASQAVQYSINWYKEYFNDSKGAAAYTEMQVKHFLS